MRSPELQAISVLSKDLNLNLTINQLSKELKKSYGFTNKYINEFIDEGILSKKVVGSAILCSLNFSNEKTIGLLMLNSVDEKIAYMKTADKKTKETLDIIKNTPSIKTFFLADGKINVICEDKAAAQAYLMEHLSNQKITILEKTEFKLQLKNLDLKNTVIIEGYEQFWRMISEMMS